MFGQINISDGINTLVDVQGRWESYWSVVDQIGGVAQEREMIVLLIPIRQYDGVLRQDQMYQLVLKPELQSPGSMTRWFHETNCRCVCASPHEVLDETGTGLHIDSIKAVFELTATRLVAVGRVPTMVINPSAKQFFNWKEEGF